jgi:hypothetical protein
LYFSCKNYQELAQERITKVVGYFTTNPTKLVLHFSVFFYDFLRNLQEKPKHFYYLSYQLQGGPRKESLFCNVVPGAGGRRGLSKIPASSSSAGPGKGGGRVYVLLGVRFGARLWARGCRRARPAELRLGSRGGSVSAMKGAWVDLLATRGVPVSARDGLRMVGCGGEAGGGGAPVGRDGGHGARAGEGNRALYSRPVRRLMPCGPKGCASGASVPGDGGRTAGQTGRPYGGAAF